MSFLDLCSMRPYRSHKIPACDRCRRQKRRCTGEGPGQPCLLCKVHNVSCQYLDNDGGNGQLTRRRRSTRAVGTASHRQFVSQLRNQVGEGVLPANVEQEVDQSPGRSDERAIGAIHHGGALNNAGLAAQSSMIVSPVITQDIQVLDHYIGAKPNHTVRGDSERTEPGSRRRTCPIPVSASTAGRPGHRRESGNQAENHCEPFA